MSRESDKLQELIQLITSGDEFYRHARERINDAELRSLLDANITARKRSLEKLGQYASKQEDGLSARLEEDRAALLAVLKFNEAHTYLDHLENLEDKTLRACEEALNTAESPDVKALLEQLRPDFVQMHDRMRAAQEASTETRLAKVGITGIHEVDRSKQSRE